jgi:transposase InsO family protein
MAGERGWPAPSYGTVRSIVVSLDPGLVTLALDGPAGYRDRFELVFRREARAANAIWQADHTQLDVMILDAGQPARPWLTVILDDFSRAVAGYAVNLAAPSALQTALALRQAIWRKPDPAWTVCGLPEVLYSDHGSDFKSHHLEQVAADLRIQLINSTAGVPQGRGKIERLFGTITTELLPQLPGYLPPSGAGPPSPPRLSLAELDAATATGSRPRITRARTQRRRSRRSSAGRPEAGCPGRRNPSSNSTSWSGGRGECPGARERVDGCCCSGSCVVDAEGCFPGVKGKARGDVQQPVAQALGLAARELAGQTPAVGSRAGGHARSDEHQPDAVCSKSRKGMLRRPVSLSLRM